VRLSDCGASSPSPADLEPIGRRTVFFHALQALARYTVPTPYRAIFFFFVAFIVNVGVYLIHNTMAQREKCFFNYSKQIL
jgi:hypothetical protein